MNKYVNVPCAKCGKPFTEDDDVVVCPDCGAPHHRSCYLEEGHCARQDQHADGSMWQDPRQEAAQKENITVNDQEVEMAIYGMAMRAQQDYKKVSEAYHKSGLIYELRDRILADKALEMVYSKAKINEVPAVSLSEPKNAD